MGSPAGWETGLTLSSKIGVKLTKLILRHQHAQGHTWKANEYSVEIFP